MNNIKDIIIGIFAVIGFAAIVTGFTNETSDPQYPESHEWEHILTDNGGEIGGAMRAHLYNKKTGEVKTIVSYNQKKGAIVTYVVKAKNDCSFCNN